MSKPTTRIHHVEVAVPSIGDTGDYDIPAAYYVHDTAFTIFKAEDGSIVASFNNRDLLSVVVGDDAE